MGEVVKLPSAADDFEGYALALALQRLRGMVDQLGDPAFLATLNSDRRRGIRVAVGLIERAMARTQL
jgi:hypothetical protein